MTDFNARPPHHLRDRIAAYEFSLDVKWQRRFTSEACTVKKGKKLSHAPSAQVTLSLRFHARLTRRDTGSDGRWNQAYRGISRLRYYGRRSCRKRARCIYVMKFIDSRPTGLLPGKLFDLPDVQSAIAVNPIVTAHRERRGEGGGGGGGRKRTNSPKSFFRCPNFEENAYALCIVKCSFVDSHFVTWRGELDRKLD